MEYSNGMKNDKRIIALNRRLDGSTYSEIALELGISRQRAQQLVSPPKDIRDTAVRRAKGRCEICGIYVGKSGQVHHIGTEWEDYNDVCNLQLLCIACHRSAHLKKRKFTRHLKSYRNRSIVRWMKRHPTWTQEQTAEKFGISQPVLSRILKRMSRISTDES